MIDANNGYNLNLAKHVLSETADCHIHWLEEAFHEDPLLYKNLKAWLVDRGSNVLIADGEGDASTHVLEWARQGLIDVLQYDYFGYGFTHWLRTAATWMPGAFSLPRHHYGGHYGNYACAHFAGAIEHLAFVEWDEAHTPGLDASAYAILDGAVNVPSRPGFGATLDEDLSSTHVRTAEAPSGFKPGYPWRLAGTPGVCSPRGAGLHLFQGKLQLLYACTSILSLETVYRRRPQARPDPEATSIALMMPEGTGQAGCGRILAAVCSTSGP